MKTKINIGLSGLLLFSGILSLAYILANGYVVELDFYLGLFFATVTLLANFKYAKIGFWLLAGVLLLGLIGLLQFCHYYYYFKIGFGPIVIKFSPIFFVLLIVFILVNKQEIGRLLNNNQAEQNKRRTEALNRQIEQFMFRFANKPYAEVQEVINNPQSYTQAAVIAAKKIIEQRKL